MSFLSNTKRKNYFGREKIILKIAGLLLIDKNDSESFWYKVYSHIGFYIFNPLYAFISLYGLYGAKIKEDAESIAFNICLCLGFAIIITITINRTKLAKLLDKMEEKPFLADSDRGGAVEEILIKNWFSVQRLQSFAFYTSITVFVSSAVAFTFIKQVSSSNPDNWIFPLGKLTVLDATNRINYEILWCSQVFAMLFIGSKSCAIMIIMHGTLSYACVHLKLLQHYLRVAVTNNNNEKSEKDEIVNSSVQSFSSSNELTTNASVSWTYLQSVLERAVSYHLKILEIISDAEEIFNVIMLIIYFAMLGSLCVIMYAISQLPLQDPRILPLITAAVGMCVFPLPVCYWGDEIAHESEEVARAAFEANFVGSDLRFQKGLLLIMRRSQRTVRIKAGKLRETSMITYGWILRTALSYFMVIRNMNIEA